MQFLNVFRPNYGYTAAIGIASATNARVCPNGIKVVRLKASCDCWVNIASPGAAAVVAGTSTSFPMNAMETEYMMINPGDQISVISNDGVTTGSLSVVEMSR